MNRVLAIAANTFREALRQRVLHATVAFMFFLICAAWILSPLTLGEGPRVVRDVGLSAISLGGMFLIVMVGTSLLSKELERRSIYVMLSKPVSRPEYLVGKYMGLVWMLSITVALMTLDVLVVDRWMNGAWNGDILLCGLGTLFELSVLTAWTMVFSSVASPFLSGLFTLGCYFIGNAVGDLRELGSMLPAGRGLLNGISYALPNLYLFNLRPQIAQGILPAPEQLAFALLYGVLYTTLILTVAVGLFRRREFV